MDDATSEIYYAQDQKKAVKSIPSSHGSLDLLTFYTGRSRFEVHLVITIHSCLPVFTSQICRSNPQ
jgi:hypothetical protein